jgi:hypothetical protein
VIFVLVLLLLAVFMISILASLLVVVFMIFILEVWVPCGMCLLQCLLWCSGVDIDLAFFYLDLVSLVLSLHLCVVDASIVELSLSSCGLMRISIWFLFCVSELCQGLMHSIYLVSLGSKVECQV